MKIPIKPHLKKFLLKRYGGHEPIAVSERSVLGICLMKILIDRREHKFDKAMNSYEDRIDLALTDQMQERSPRLYRLISINKEVEKLFLESLVMWIQAQKEAGNPARFGVESFLKWHGIADHEYSCESGYRHWLRVNERERRHSKKNSSIELKRVS